MGQPEKRSASESSDTGILWSWEDRGNGLFTFLVGGASRQGWTPGTGGKLATRMHNHSEVRGSSLWEDRHSQPIRIRTNWHWTVREGHGSQKKGRTCRCWMTEGTVGKKSMSPCAKRLSWPPLGRLFKVIHSISTSLFPYCHCNRISFLCRVAKQRPVLSLVIPISRPHPP